MITFIKNLLFKRSDEPLDHGKFVMGQPPDLNFDDLKNNFYKRTYSFPWYQEKLFPHNPRLLHWIGSVDYSGYTRETSLDYLITHYQPGDENRILLRLEDWVPKIQAKAQQWTEKNFHTLSLHQLNSNYQLLLYLSRKEKLQQSPILHLINTCLVKKVRGIEHSQFSTYHPRFRRYLYALALPENRQLRPWLLADADPFNRTLLLTLYQYDELTSEEIHRLQHDKSVMVRRKVLKTQIQRGIRPTQDILIQYCFDKNVSIREYARFYAQKFYGIDAYNLYIEQEDDTFYYLADYARKEDCDVFLDGIHSHNLQIKYLCLKALCHIDTMYLRQLNVKELLASNRKIRKVVCASIPHVMTIEQLHELKETLIHVHPQGMLLFLHMLYRKSFWQFLDESLLFLLQDPSEQSIQFITRIYHRKPYIYETLPEELSQRIAEKARLLEHHENYYIRELIKQIQFSTNLLNGKYDK